MLDNIPSLSIYIPGIFNYISDSDDDTMGSATPNSRRGMARRDSIRSNSGGRRPRLLRSSATEPSITPSTASRNGLASQDTRRATDLLIQFSSSPPNSASPLSQSPSSIYEGPSMDHLPREAVSMDGFRPHMDASQRYVSFPSFDTWDPDRDEQSREPEMKSP